VNEPYLRWLRYVRYHVHSTGTVTWRLYSSFCFFPVPSSTLFDCSCIHILKAKVLEISEQSLSRNGQREMNLAVPHVVQTISETLTVSLNKHNCLRILMPSFGSHSCQHRIREFVQRRTGNFKVLAANIESRYTLSRHIINSLQAKKLGAKDIQSRKIYSAAHCVSHHGYNLHRVNSDRRNTLARLWQLRLVLACRTHVSSNSLR
jgi:hypothetical protein